MAVHQSYLGFMGRQLCRPWIYMLFLVTLAMYILYSWRGWIRNAVYWEIR